MKNGRSVGHRSGACHKASDGKVKIDRKEKKVQYQNMGVYQLKFQYLLRSWGAGIYICTCSFLLAVGGALMVIVDEWSHLRLAGTMGWTKIDVALIHNLFYEGGYNWDYQLPNPF